VLAGRTLRGQAPHGPELFDTFHAITTQAREVVTKHLSLLASQIARIVADGIVAQDFARTDPAVAGRAVLQATARFHHPAHAAEWFEPSTDADLDAVVSLLLAGLSAAAPSTRITRPRAATAPR
jgi:Tetracyclin repressor-like, C-terminal domain